MAIPISNPPSPGGPSFEPPPPSPPPLFGPNVNQDTSGSALINQVIQIPGGQTIVLSDARITIGQFSDAVSLSVSGSKQMIQLGALTSLLANSKIAVTQGDLANALAVIRAQIALLQEQEANLLSLQNSQITNLNNAISDLNDAVSATAQQDKFQTDAMNDAIQAYNNGDIDNAQFNAAAAAYNAYATTRNAALQPLINNYVSAANAFQQQVDPNNTLIDTLNPILASYDIPELPHQIELPANPPTAALMPIQSSAPLTTPVPLLPYPQTMPLVHPIGPPVLNPIDFVTNYYQPIAQEIINNLAQSNLRMDIHTAFTDFIFFFLPGKKVTDPPSFISEIPQVFMNATVGNATGGVGVASISPIFDSSAINGVLSTAILSANQKTFQLQFSLAPLSQLVFFGNQLSTYGGLQSAVTGMRLLGLNTLTNSRATTAFGIAFGLSNSQIVAQEISSGKIKEFVQQVVTQELGNRADQATIDNTTEFLNANLNLSLLQSSLLTSSAALGTPGLVGQIFGNVNGVPPQASTQSQQTLNQAANNTLNQLFLKTILVEQLIHSQAVKDEAKAQQVINDSINAVVQQGKIENAENFKNALAKQLIAANIAADIANTLATLGTRLLTEEAKAQAILNENLLKQTKVQEILASEIIQQTQLNEQEAHRIVQNAINQAFEHSLISNAFEFQYALQNQLILAGIKSDAAAKALFNTVAALNIPSPATSPLSNPVLASVLSPIELGNNLHGFIQSQLTALDPERARDIANQVVATFIGTPGISPLPGQAPSILSLINKNVETIQRLGGPHGIDLLAQSFRNYLAPNIDLLAFSRRILDPAYNLFFSAGTGVMYAGKPHPSNFKQEVDIRV